MVWGVLNHPMRRRRLYMVSRDPFHPGGQLLLYGLETRPRRHWFISFVQHGQDRKNDWSHSIGACPRVVVLLPNHWRSIVPSAEEGASWPWNFGGNGSITT